MAQQFAWMELLLERAKTISPEEKREVQRRLSMYDPLWEEHPKVKQIKAKARAEVREAKVQAQAEVQEAQANAERLAEELVKVEKARLEAELEQAARLKAELEQLAEGTIKPLRVALITLVHTRFPTLTELAQTKVAQVDTPQLLSYLLEQIAASCDENEARLFLRPAAA